MNLLNKLTIKRRMILSFALISVFFTMFGYFTLRQMNTLSALTTTLYRHPLQVSNAALSAKARMISMHRHMKDLSTAKTQLDIALFTKKVQDEEVEVYKELSLVKENILGTEGKKLAEEATGLFSGWKPIRAEVQEFVLQGNTETANRITRGKGADYVAQLERKMGELSQYARDKADGFMIDARITQDRISRNFLIFTSILIILAVSTGALISASILKSITKLQDTMRRITHTGELQEATLSGNNEISQMSEYFNGLIFKLKEQFWLRESTNSLNQALAGNQSYDEILQNSIEEICQDINACSGAIFSFDQGSGQCHRKAVYALPDGREFSSSFKLGHGIVGQVAADRQPILLENLQNSEILLESGTTSSGLLHLLALPLLHEENLLGVLEIASLNRIGTIKRQYLESAAKIIATALNTAEQNAKIKSLLESSEESNRTLQNQTQELRLQTQELQVLNVEIQQQSEELKGQNRELEYQRRQVEEANRLKSEFLSNMSHELRTPLNSVNALSRVLIMQTGNKLSREELNYLEIIERNGKHLLALINDILDLSKIESGRVDVEISRFSINHLLENIIENISPLAADKQLRIDHTTPDSLPLVESDESRMHQILQNIIANAVKFTDAGSITITSYSENEQIRIDIKDTGIGISARDQETIFDEFRQADGATSRKFEGTGLGLAIAYKAAKLLGGDIRVNSELGKGTVFSVLLPVVYRGPAREILLPDPPVSAIDSVAERSVGSNTILIVDDDPEALATLSSLLENAGYTTLAAASGDQALKLAKSEQPLAITLDIVMPGMDGWEVLGRLKEDPATSTIPVIITSIAEEQATGFALGAVGYVNKPITPDELLHEIEQASRYLPTQVLIVDDDDVDRQLTGRVITQAGMKALFADGGHHCLELLEKTIPDVVVLDLVMPQMDGFDLLNKLRSKPETAHLPVIVQTAKELTAEEKARLETSVSSVHAKGADFAAGLLDDIKRILRLLSQQTENQPNVDTHSRDRILVVEDNEVAVIQVRKALETLGVIVDVASNGQEALDYLKYTLPKGIILDLMMPHIDGFQTLESMRATAKTREIPVLILTAKDLTHQEINRLSSNNVQQLIQKGDVDKSELLEKVSTMLHLPMTENGDNFQQDQHRPAPYGPAPAPGASVKRGQGTSPLILAIEDNPDNVTTIRAVLPRDLSIEEANDGREGLYKALDLLPDLILLDIALPGMDGLEVVSFLKNNAKTKSIPVIAFTAQAMKGDRERILEAGCDDYIAKPITPETLRETVSYWLG